jgi:HlyD family secretion protein
MIKNYPLRALWVTLALVSACHAARGDEEPRYQGVAELDERRLGFEVSGRLLTLSVREGDRIGAGALLGTLDGALDVQQREARELEARAAHAQSELVERGTRSEEIAATRARLRAARATEDLQAKQLARERELFARGVSTEAQVDDRERSVAQAVAEREALQSLLAEQERGARPEERTVARARADAARANVELDDLRLDKRELRSPIDGVVLDVLIDEGEVALAGAPVLNVADPAQMYTEVFVPQAEIAQIRLGARARLHADGIAAPLAGAVQRIEQRTEFTPRYLFSERERPNLVVRVKVGIEDPAGQLRAGVPVFVAIDRSAPTAAAPTHGGPAQ